MLHDDGLGLFNVWYIYVRIVVFMCCYRCSRVLLVLLVMYVVCHDDDDDDVLLHIYIYIYIYIYMNVFV